MTDSIALDPRRTKSILDPIHGLVRLTESEMSVISHRLFQRLRSIRQNGLLHLVFPAATHTRFEHSLGVLYVAHGMLNSLWLNSQVAAKKGGVRPASEGMPGEAVEFLSQDTDVRESVYGVTRLAALVHDLGHGPLSHTFDSFAPRRSQLERVLEASDLSALRPLRDLIVEWGFDPSKSSSSGARVPHEIMSCIFFAKIWHDLRKEDAVATAVCATILGSSRSYDGSSAVEDDELRPWIPLMHDLVASAPADADRMDYMERDSRSIGVSYGLFDRNRVLKSLLCYRTGSEGQSYRLGIKKSGIQAIENLLQARYELFAQIYYHKTNRAISLMLERIGEHAKDDVDLFGGPPSIEDWISRYCDLSDDQFMRILSGRGAGPDEIPTSIRSIANQIAERNLWKRILEPTKEEEAKLILETLQEEFHADAELLKIDSSKPKALKDLNGGAAVLAKNKDGVYSAGERLTWESQSVIIPALKEADSRSSRIYYQGEDGEAARRIRERAVQLAFIQRGKTDGKN